MTSRPRTFLFSVILGSLLGCSPADDGTPANGSGGTVGTGGSSSPQGGSTASGGTSGGGTSSGGTPSTTGGASTTGGTPSTGGTPGGTGGASGGTPSTGGTPSSGGGTPGAGGMMETGGAAGSDGTGGASGGEQGGSGGAGGAGGSDGGNGGSGGDAGGSAPMAPLGASGYPVPPGDGNVPRPSGTPNGITVLNWAGFKGAVSYTFDDTNESQVQNFNTLNGLGVRMTFYLQTNKSQISSNVWKQAVESGHELGNHTHSHPQNNPSGQDIDQATQIIQNNFGVTVYTMAAPYGETAYAALAKDRFLMNRGVNGGLIPPTGNNDPYNLPTFIPDPDKQNYQQEMNSWIDQVRSQGAWATVLVHGFTGDGSAYKAFPLQVFVDHVNYAKSHGDVWIDSVINVGAYWLGQRAFSQAMVATEGDKKTWTWKLPNHFPPGKYLRVTVDGGTLEQDGLVIPWDPNGYYEIALDKGSVTLSP